MKVVFPRLEATAQRLIQLLWCGALVPKNPGFGSGVRDEEGTQF